ncbi:hypothetical protein D3C81_1442080 [compost metagenome]
MADALRTGVAERLLEGTVERLAVAAGQRHAHHALQQAGVLRQVGVVDFRYLVAAVEVVVEGDGQGAEGQQEHHHEQRAAAQRGHALPSTR